MDDIKENTEEPAIDNETINIQSIVSGTTLDEVALMPLELIKQAVLDDSMITTDTSSSITQTVMSPEELLKIQQEEQQIVDRLKPTPSYIPSKSFMLLPPLSSLETKSLTSFEDHLRELTTQISIEKVENFGLGFRKKGDINHIIQTAIIHIFSKLCEGTVDDGIILQHILENFKEAYLKFITSHLAVVFKTTKPLLDDFFKNNEREMTYEFLLSLFLESVKLSSSPASNFQTEPLKVNSINNMYDLLGYLRIQGISDSYLSDFSRYIYENIKRAIEQRFIIAAYTLLYYYTAILQIAYYINIHDVFTKTKGMDNSYVKSMITGILISFTQSLTRYLFHPAEKFDYFFPLECSLIIQSTAMAEKIKNPLTRATELAKLTSSKPTPEPSSSGFFGFFKS